MAAEDSSAVNPPRNSESFEQENRSRNLLARVRSILSQMAETQPSARDFAAHLEGRLSALWRAEDAFNRSGSDLELILLDELQTLDAAADSVTLDGPDIRLDARTSGVMILAVHELATNALKFGALGRLGGQLAVSWSVSQAKSGKRLRFEWVESGVSIVAEAPRHQGFGHDLITRRIGYELGGEGELRLSPGGITCLIEIPLQA